MGSACSGARTVRVNVAEESREGNGNNPNKPSGNWMVGSEIFDVQQSAETSPAAVSKTGPKMKPGGTPHTAISSKGVGALLGVLQRNANQVFMSANFNSNHQEKSLDASSADSLRKQNDPYREANQSNTKSPQPQRDKPKKQTSENEPQSPEGKIIITGKGTYSEKDLVKTTIIGEYSLRRTKKDKGGSVKNVPKGSSGDSNSGHSNTNAKVEIKTGESNLASEDVSKAKVFVTGGGGGGESSKIKKTFSKHKTRSGGISTSCYGSDADESHLHLPQSDLEGKARLEQHFADKFLESLKAKAAEHKPSAYKFQMGTTECTCSSCTTPPNEISVNSKRHFSENELKTLLLADGGRLGDPMVGIRRSKSDLLHLPRYDYSWLKLSGEVDDCNCKVESVSEFNNLRIYPRVKSLVSKDYFRFFKVNLNKPCPFWPDDGQCAIRACAVCPCTDDEVPCGLKDEEEKGKQENKYSKEVNDDATQEEENCETRSEEEIRLSALDTSISPEIKAAFETWKEHDDAQVNFCDLDDEQSNVMAYVDLLLNPERYTGYKGPSPHRIWNSIYNENCFKPDPNTTGYQSLLTNKAINKGLCLEKRVFYRLISGLHSSINIHLCADYLLSEDPFAGEVWGPNIEEFKRRFDPITSDGEGPIRLKNLYFTYLVVLRAIAKAAPILEKEAFYTGNNESDKEVKKAIVEVLGVIQSFNNHFNESLMFQGNPEQASQLKEEFRSHFWNISRIMDCVGCDKCKLWGKLQVRGLGTALKILFTSSKHPLRLTRQEIVPLLVGFSKLSHSIAQVENFQQWIAKDSTDPAAAKRKGSPFV